MRKCLVFDVLTDFGTRRWHRVPLRARQLHQTSRDASRSCVHSSDIAMPRHLPISAPRLFDIPTVRLYLDTPRSNRMRDRVGGSPRQGVPLGGVECTVFVPLGGVEWRDTEAAMTLGIPVEPQRHSVEWRDRYVPRAPLRRSMASRISCRVTTRKTVKSRSTQDLPDGLRYYVT